MTERTKALFRPQAMVHWGKALAAVRLEGLPLSQYEVRNLNNRSLMCKNCTRIQDPHPGMRDSNQEGVIWSTAVRYCEAAMKASSMQHSHHSLHHYYIDSLHRCTVGLQY